MTKSLFPQNVPGPQPRAQTLPARNNSRLSNGLLVGQSVTTLASGPGPNAFEIGVISLDPDTGVLNVRVKDSVQAEEIDCTVMLADMQGSGTIEIVLGDSKLSPKVEIKISPRVTPPKFATIDEAEAWMEANA